MPMWLLDIQIIIQIGYKVHVRISWLLQGSLHAVMRLVYFCKSYGSKHIWVRIDYKIHALLYVMQ